MPDELGLLQFTQSSQEKLFFHTNGFTISKSMVMVGPKMFSPGIAEGRKGSWICFYKV